jgi:predicted transcriptional regulator
VIQKTERRIKKGYSIKVSDIMTTKVVKISYTSNLYQATRLMNKENTDVVIIVDGQKSLGIISERDILKFFFKKVTL